MKKIFILFLLILVPGLALADQVVVQGNSVNVRESASSKSKVIKTAHQGDVLELVDTQKEKGYYKVQVDNQEGFVYGRYVTLQAKEAAAGTTPVVSTSKEPATHTATTHVSNVPLSTDSNVITNNRDDSVYQNDSSGNPYSPDEIMDPANFKDITKLHYVKVSGYLTYVAGSAPANGTTTTIRIEADGDIHFELASANTQRPARVNPNGLVCEITPPYQLDNGTRIGDFVNQFNPSTYKKITVYGYLRYGTEGTTHSGYHEYPLGSSTFGGHWEIHPVEKVEVEDVVIGKDGKYVTEDPSARYKLNASNFQKSSMSNHGELKGKVTSFQSSPDNSGDEDVQISDAQGNTTLVVIPVYYIKNTGTQTVDLRGNLDGFSTVNAISIGQTYTFDGLRSWRFDNDIPTALMEPLEKVSQ